MRTAEDAHLLSARGNIDGAGPNRLALPGFVHSDVAQSVKPDGESIREARGHVLGNNDGSREITRQQAQDVLQYLGAASRSANGNDLNCGQMEAAADCWTFCYQAGAGTQLKFLPPRR